MRTSNQYSDEQRRVWKERDQAMSAAVKNMYVPDMIGLTVMEISRTEYNRTKAMKDGKIIINKPNMFMIKIDADTFTVYFSIGDMCYKTVGGISPYLPEHFEQKFKTPRISTNLVLNRAD